MFLRVIGLTDYLTYLKNRLVNVDDMWEIGRGEGSKAWKWRRRLFAWEEDLVKERCTVLHNIILHVNVSDMWNWLLDSIKGFSVREVYHFFHN